MLKSFIVHNGKIGILTIKTYIRSSIRSNHVFFYAIIYFPLFVYFFKDDFSPILKLRETKIKVNPIFLPSLHHLAKNERTLHETLRTLRSSEWPNFVLHSRNLGVVKKVLEVVSILVKAFIIIIYTF